MSVLVTVVAPDGLRADFQIDATQPPQAIAKALATYILPGLPPPDSDELALGPAIGVPFADVALREQGFLTGSLVYLFDRRDCVVPGERPRPSDPRRARVVIRSVPAASPSRGRSQRIINCLRGYVGRRLQSRPQTSSAVRHTSGSLHRTTTTDRSTSR